MPVDRSHYSVLVVGAGPTGLAAASALARLGISVRIIDKSQTRSDKSKALGIQAGTLECLENVCGEELTLKLVNAGSPVKDVQIHLDNDRPIYVDFGHIPSRYNYILILDQSETERILEEYLNNHDIRVERQTELIEINDRGDYVISSIQNNLGNRKEIQSSFVIGCDGAHSTIRHLLRFSFKGGSYTGDFILGDVTLKWPWPHGALQASVSQQGVIASFRMKGNQQYRLILIPRTPSSKADEPEITLEEFCSIVSTLSQNQIKVLNSKWLTRFRVHHRMVEQMQKGRVFLAGDSAHIHSPIGAQGMNTGIQDALNLAFKLKRVLQDNLTLETLKHYERERIPVARRVLRSTDFAFRLALLPETDFSQFLRRTIFSKIVSIPFIQRRIVSAISEISIARQEIARFKL